ncbi:SGNH/GDSL hydrolase family protein [Paenibacillus sp. SI8]|uniref:SGNH/GDSL hydrolase family protein n=1 Tax=unclassified Paenibacillus TaxID=185978 RepID=UPI003466AB15
MKQVLCFGDSNTWGSDPAGFNRYTREQRWTGVLHRALEGKIHVIEEGLGGRTTVWDDPIENKMSGKNYLFPCLDSHKPLDLVIIMLGTNDLKKRFSVSAGDIARSVVTLIQIVEAHSPQAEILVLAPPPIKEIGGFAEMFEGGAEKSKHFSSEFAKIPQTTKAHLLVTSKLIAVSDVDGIHLSVESHAILGEAVANIVKSILNL